MSVDGKDAMHSSYPSNAEVCSNADSWYPLSPIIEDCVSNAHNREEISLAISLFLGYGGRGVETREEWKTKQYTRQRSATDNRHSEGAHCAEPVRPLLEAANTGIEQELVGDSLNMGKEHRCSGHLSEERMIHREDEEKECERLGKGQISVSLEHCLGVWDPSNVKVS